MALRHLLAIVFGIVAYYTWVHITKDSDVTITFDDLPENLQKWRKMGNVISINGRKMFFIYKKCSNPNIKHPPTFAIIHGFPSSSYEYHKALEDLSKHGNVLLNDHIGFGFSDAPTEGYTYSLSEAADNLLALWRHVGLKKAHIVSHDMGDSILTEILARRFRKMLPSDLDDIIVSLTFTNGGMNFKMINFRLAQRIMMYPQIGSHLAATGKILGLVKPFFMKTVGGIWSPYADPVEKEKDLNELYLLNLYNGAHSNMHNINYYLWDRYHFEYKWFAALKELDLPCRFVWGDSDAVSPIAIPKYFENIVPKFDLTLVEKGGHFWMLENPRKWVEEVVKILKY